MSVKIKYTDEPIEPKVIHDFLPPPEEFAFREEGGKVTIALSKKSVEFFKSETEKIPICAMNVYPDGLSKVLTKEIAYKKLQSFFLEKPFVLFGTGTSCAVHPDYGMPALSEHLLAEIPGQVMSLEQKRQWNSVSEALESGCDLESALDGIKDEHLVRLIVNRAADLVTRLDREHGRKIFLAEKEWPALSFFKRLVDSFGVLHVATPNYDLLAEYAFERANLPYSTGFVGGVCRRLDWPLAVRSRTCSEKIIHRGKMKFVNKPNRHIRLYKVHGSLNTFNLHDNIVENNAWMFEVPDGIERVMITPGTMKYERLLDNRSDLLKAYDAELAKHNAFLFIGFGFNDNQLIKDSLMRKLRDQKCQALIITRDSNKRIENLARECENIWLVCAPQNGDSKGTLIFNSRKGELYLADITLWDPREFAQKILGD